MAQLAGVGGQDCDEALVESGSYQVTAHPASSQGNATIWSRHVNAKAPAGPIVSKGQTPGSGADTILAVEARTDSAHRLTNALLGAQLGEVVRGVGRAPVGVKRDPA